MNHVSADSSSSISSMMSTELLHVAALPRQIFSLSLFSIFSLTFQLLQKLWQWSPF